MIMGVSIIHENASRLKDTDKLWFIEEESKWNSTYYQQMKNVRVGIIIDESKYQSLLQQLNIELTKLRKTKVVAEIKEIQIKINLFETEMDKTLISLDENTNRKNEDDILLRMDPISNNIPKFTPLSLISSSYSPLENWNLNKQKAF